MSGVFSCSTPLSIPEMWPTSLDIPVAVTTISPRPRVTCEFMYAMSTRSPSGTSSPVTGSRLLATGVLSPVSPASSISSVAGDEDPTVGRHLVAGLEADDVARDQLLGRDLDAADRRGGRSPS